MKHIRVTLEMDVDDLSDAARLVAAKDMECDVGEIPKMAEYDAALIAHVLGNIGEGTSEELFAGTDIYVQIKEVRVTSADWIADGPSRESKP